MAQRTAAGVRQTVVAYRNVLVHVHVGVDGLAAAAVSDEDYSVRAAFALLARVRQTYATQTPKWAQIDADTSSSSLDGGGGGGGEPDWLVRELAAWQAPDEADKMMKIQKNLDEIKDILQANIQDVLQRGETMDALAKQSQDLSEASKQFHNNVPSAPCCKLY